MCKMLFDMYIVLCFVLLLITMAFGSVAELAYDKKSHKKLLDGEIEYEKFYRYLRYAS